MTAERRWGGEQLDAVSLGEKWHRDLESAPSICETLPVEEVGTCVAGDDGELFRGDLAALQEALRGRRIRYHHGTLGGAWPSFPR
jgi:hypothetical protein